MEENNNEKKVIAPNLKEILDKVSKMKELTPSEISKLEEKVKESTDFKRLIENIEIPKDNYVIFTDGEEQLVYENGEFFIVSTIDSTKEKKKKKRLEAKDMYIEYFIRYTLNKIQNKGSINIEKVEPTITKVNEEIVKEEPKIKKVENQEKEITKEMKKESEEKTIEKGKSVKEDSRSEEIDKALKSMVKPINEEYERTKIIDKIKNGKEKSDKIR